MGSKGRGDVLYQALFLGGMSLLAMFVMVCGLGLAFGSRTVSKVGFFGALAMMAVLWLLLRRYRPGAGKKSGPAMHG